MRQITIRITAVLTVLSLALCGLFTGCAGRYYEGTSFAMGSVLTARLYTSDEKGTEIFGELSEAVADTDKMISATDSASELFRLNDAGFAKLSRRAIGLLKDSLTVCHILDGKTDVTIGAVSELWGFSTDSPSKPSEEALAGALKTVGTDNVSVYEEEKLVQLQEGTKLDLGAFGKGAAADSAYDILRSYDLSAVVTLGGTVLLYGRPVSGRTWKVAVRDPFGTENDTFGTLSLTPGENDDAVFVSTSGSYEKQFTENGMTYHHILSPETGMPVQTDLVSVTVVANAGLNCDALSTYCFINGFNDETLAKLAVFKAEALFVYKDGACRLTDGLKDSFRLTDTGHFRLADHEA